MSQSIENEKVWDCEKCTFRNSFNEKICEICEAKRPVFKIKKAENINNNTPLEVYKNDFYQCKKCTLVNNSEDNFCQSCETPKTESIKPDLNNNYQKGSNINTNDYESIKIGLFFEENSIKSFEMFFKL